MTWELSLLGAPRGPGCCSEQGGLLSLTGLSPRAWSSQLKMGPRPATLTSGSKPSRPLTLPSPLVAGTGMSATSIFGDHPEKQLWDFMLLQSKRCKSRHDDISGFNLLRNMRNSQETLVNAGRPCVRVKEFGLRVCIPRQSNGFRGNKLILCERQRDRGRGEEVAVNYR